MGFVRWVGVVVVAGVVAVLGVVLWPEDEPDKRVSDSSPRVVEGNVIGSVRELFNRLDDGGIHCASSKRDIELESVGRTKSGDCYLGGSLEADVYVFPSSEGLRKWLDGIPKDGGVSQIDAVWGSNWLVTARTRSLLLWVRRLLGGTLNDPSYMI